jgi:hypothetical protein
MMMNAGIDAITALHQSKLGKNKIRVKLKN